MSLSQPFTDVVVRRPLAELRVEVLIGDHVHVLTRYAGIQQQLEPVTDQRSTVNWDERLRHSVSVVSESV